MVLIFGLRILIFALLIPYARPDCVPNSELLKDKLEQKRHEPDYTDHSKPPTNGLEMSLKIQRIIRAQDIDEIVINGFLTKRYVDKDLDYSNLFPCEEYAIVRISNMTALKTPHVSLMTGELVSGKKTEANAIVFPNGTVLETQRVALQAPCTSDSSTPFSTLSCRLIWHNRNYRQNEMFVIWSENVEKNLSTFEDGIQNPGSYRIQELKFTHNVLRNPIGDFDELIFTAELGKSKIKELIFFYLPQLMFVAISWLSMFLGPMAITRSVLIIGSMVLLLLHQHFFIGSNLSDSGSFSSYEIWQLATFLFTFFTLVELIIITCMASAGRSRRLLSVFGKKNKKEGRSFYSFEPMYEELNDLRNRKAKKTCACCSYSALAVDIISLIASGIVFGFFVLLYFGATEKIIDFFNNFTSTSNETNN
ncbi:hypothetical protein FO519_003794 [Halicephalobus sp. NKZ332]|nr:hypothetical protein FO519_003794 [Halicephalobus sp. NKZ332]